MQVINGALTIAKVYKVYGKTYWKFRYIWGRVPESMGDHRKELHTRHTGVIVENS